MEHTHANADGQRHGEFLCLTYAFGWYEVFVPIYIFSILHSYPEAFVRIVFEGLPSAKVKACLARLRNCGFTRFEAIEEHVPCVEYENPIARMSERWVLDKSFFEGFEYAWIGDVDFLHIREEPTWLERELKRARLIGFPYSNVVREPPLQDSLSGLHFIVVEPYFAAMQDAIAEAKQDPETVRLNNEELLYRMVKKGIGVLESDQPRPFIWQEWHGLHLGLFRIKHGILDWMKKHQRFRELVREQTADPLLSELVETMDHAELNLIFSALKREFNVP